VSSKIFVDMDRHYCFQYYRQENDQFAEQPGLGEKTLTNPCPVDATGKALTAFTRPTISSDLPLFIPSHTFFDG